MAILYANFHFSRLNICSIPRVPPVKRIFFITLLFIIVSNAFMFDYVILVVVHGFWYEMGKWVSGIEFVEDIGMGKNGATMFSTIIPTVQISKHSIYDIYIYFNYIIISSIIFKS